VSIYKVIATTIVSTFLLSYALRDKESEQRVVFILIRNDILISLIYDSGIRQFVVRYEISLMHYRHL